MEASKDTIENLIKNSSRTIEKLFAKLSKDIIIYDHCDEKISLLLRLSIELRRDICFILIDLLTSLRACIAGTRGFEKCYHIKNMEGVRVEAYNLLCGYNKAKEYAIWNRIGKEIEKKVLTSENSQLYDRLSDFYALITRKINAIMATNEERTSRNLTYHYDEDLLKIYEQIARVLKEGEDEPSRHILYWMDLHLLIQAFCNVIEDVEHNQGNRLPKSIVQYPNLLTFGLYKRMAEELNNKREFHNALNKVLESVDRIDWAAFQKKRLIRVQDYLLKETSENKYVKLILNFIDLLNVHILIHILYADMASVMKAFMNSGCDIEYPLTLRRLSISKVSALSHLVGYDDKEKKVALWPLVQSSIMDDAKIFRLEAASIRTDFESLVKDEDIKVRGIYVHLIDRYTHESNVPQIISKIEDGDMILNLNDFTSLMQIMGKAKKFLEKWLMELVIRVSKTTKKNTIELRAQINNIRKLINNTNIPLHDRKSMNDSLNKIENLFNI